MEIKAYLKNLKISPKKLRFLLNDIKKFKPTEALNRLYYSPNKAARIFYYAIKSAIDNAKNTYKINEDLLKFKLLTIEEGQKLKRYQIGGRGGMKPYFHRRSHIKIILKSEEPLKLRENTELKQVKKETEIKNYKKDVTKVKKSKKLKVKPSKLSA